MEQLTVYNSLTRKKETFEPLNPPFVGMYVCGPTVYGNAHLGHARSAISFDIVFRYLMHIGYKVRYVRNVTDVGHLENDADFGDSKVEQQARVEQLEPMEIAQRYFNNYIEDMNALNVLRPSIEPMATGHIPEQIEAVEKILEHGYAYISNDSVYFDVEKYDKDFDYGSLSGRDLENMREESRDNLDGQEEKRNGADFALWKKASPSHIMRWNSPWGPGFPGWHIECTVMSTKYLGHKYDIHGGGMDLIFPHHEAEIAQSNACNHQLPKSEQNEAKYWLHNNMITYEGKKMGKSLGNAIGLREFFSGDHPLLEQAYTANTIRFFMLQAHYGSTLDFSNKALQSAEKGLNRLSEGLKRLMAIDPDSLPAAINDSFEKNLATFPADLRAQMNDDFNTARVIARMFDSLTVVNQLAVAGQTGDGVKAETFRNFRQAFSEFFFDVLGLRSEQEEESAGESMDGLMQLLISIRDEARKDKNWDISDKIRDELTRLKIKLQDGREGTEWYFDK